MTMVQKAWENLRIAYQCKYAGMCKKVKGDESNAYHQGAMSEMSYVLITVFGLTKEQVKEVEKNGGLTNADIETE